MCCFNRSQDVLNIHKKIQKTHTKTINLKYHLHGGLVYLNYMLYWILYQVFNITLIISTKDMAKSLIILQRIHVRNIENRITFRTKTGYYLNLLQFETVKLLGST